MSGCPIQFTFGKDIASIIHRYVWLCSIRLVNREFFDMYGIRNNAHSFYVYSRKTGLRFNFRKKRQCNFVINMKSVVARIPKNYWEIKELY